jgi:hypothetical protein
LIDGTPAGILPAMQRNHLPPDSYLDLPRKQLDRYSLAELIGATDRGDQRTLQFYRECSDAIAERSGRHPGTISGYFIPSDYLMRDMTVAGVSGSNYIVGTQQLSFGGSLFASSITARQPLRRAALTGNGTLTVATTAATSTWLSAEDAQIADAAMAFGQRSATPKTISTVALISKTMDLSAPAVASYIEQQFGAKAGQDIDTAFINGSGNSGEPLGLLIMSGTTSQSGTNLAYSGVCTMIAAAEGYSGTPHVLLGKDTAKLLRQRAKVTSGEPIFSNGTVDGLPTIVSRAMPADAMLVFDLALLTEVRFGAMEVVVSPLATPTAFRVGAIGIRLMQSVDFLTDHAAAVVKSTSIT